MQSRLRFSFPAYVFLTLFTRDQLRQPALLPRRGVLVDDALLSGTVEQLDRVSIRRLGLRTRCRTDLPESGPELTTLGTIGDSPGSGLAHTLGGRLDSGHGILSDWGIPSGAVPEIAAENIGRSTCKVKREAVLTCLTTPCNLPAAYA
jgi:hypothetical protein